MTFQSDNGTSFVGELTKELMRRSQKAKPHSTTYHPQTKGLVVVQIDHQKIRITNSGYNQVLVMIDHFTKYAEDVSCINDSAEETCDHLINARISRHECPMTFQSNNGTV